MARPKKPRIICSYPGVMGFRPFGTYAETIDLTFDEYEAFRLIDKLGYSQQECAKHGDKYLRKRKEQNCGGNNLRQGHKFSRRRCGNVQVPHNMLR